VTDIVWEWMANSSTLLPAVNPHNAVIERLFGDQGGH
jgi:hypothetical protein